MIVAKCHTKEWIEDRSNFLKSGKRRADPGLIEKVIKALYLLESLSKEGLEFIFKGGTSLLLLLDTIHRFSIDIDIIVENKMESEELKLIFNKIIENSIFYRYEEDQRKKTTNIEKAHYKFYYKSVLDDREKYILLDILFKKNPYVELVEKEIDCDFIENEGENVIVKVPSIDCILGDKMTAFAPNTTGIPYDKDKELEIIKQLFDVSNLFQEAKDLGVVKKTFIEVANTELKYRQMEEKDFENVLDDIYQTSLLLPIKGDMDSEKYSKLMDGVKRIKSYIFSKNFTPDEAILCGGKAAYLSLLLKQSETTIKHFNLDIDVRGLSFDDPRLNKIFKPWKKTNPEAFYYWNKSIELHNKMYQSVEGASNI